MKTDALEVINPTPSDLLHLALSKGTDIAQLTQLLDLKERWERNEARKAFVSAMNAFKAAPPTITKNKTVSFGNTNYSHATLDHVCDSITKALSEHGIQHRWKMTQTDGGISVTCILTHEAGHSEETTLTSGPDTSGSKNSIQAIGSAVTYLQRYTLLAATGLATTNGDNDGHGVTNGDLAEQLEYIANACTADELKKLYTAAYKMFDGNQAALRQIVAAKDARKKEL